MTASPEGTHLEPCPFCGGEAYLYGAEVHCRGCQVQTANVREWSRRAPCPFTKEELEALEVSILVIASGLNYPIHMPRYADDLKKTKAILRAMLDSSKGGD